VFVFKVKSLIWKVRTQGLRSRKYAFNTLNDHFEGKHNAVNGLYGQTLTS